MYSYRLEKIKITAERVWKFLGSIVRNDVIMTNGIRKVRQGVNIFYKIILDSCKIHLRQILVHGTDSLNSRLSNGFWFLKGVFAKNERGYRFNAIKKRFWSLLILLLSVASIRRKLLKLLSMNKISIIFSLKIQYFQLWLLSLPKWLAYFCLRILNTKN